ncbi:MAG: hypothetical protein ACI9DO_001671 [Reinekea sp.]
MKFAVYFPTANLLRFNTEHFTVSNHKMLGTKGYNINSWGLLAPSLAINLAMFSYSCRNTVIGGTLTTLRVDTIPTKPINKPPLIGPISHNQ